MNLNRRDFIAGAVAVAGVSSTSAARARENASMYGLISSFVAAAGQRDALIDILLAGTRGMEGCLAYIVARDAADANTVWITEVWTGKEAHDASLTLPAVGEAMRKGKPLIAGFGKRTVIVPVGGQGLPTR